MSGALINVGFGTAALGQACYDVVKMALAAGFRKFDTAEADWWYDQAAVGRALQDFALQHSYLEDDECVMIHRDAETGQPSCVDAAMANLCSQLAISTKIPPWELVSADHIRDNARHSRTVLLGFCDEIMDEKKPLDVYFIHAPTCWPGWHSRCDDHPPLLDLRSSWLAMEAIVADGSAKRIGLSNVSPDELLDIIEFVQQRKQQQNVSADSTVAPPRLPDAVQIFADPIQPAEEMRRICQAHNIEFVSYSTLGTQHRTSSNGQNPVLGSPIVAALAAKHERSVAEVVLSWALQHGMSVIPRSNQKQHIDELARLLTDQPGFLDDTDLARMDGLRNSA
jgi:diketogulonate reductase-like aldo/keto reductase